MKSDSWSDSSRTCARSTSPTRGCAESDFPRRRSALRCSGRRKASFSSAQVDCARARCHPVAAAPREEAGASRVRWLAALQRRQAGRRSGRGGCGEHLGWSPAHPQSHRARRPPVCLPKPRLHTARPLSSHSRGCAGRGSVIGWSWRSATRPALGRGDRDHPFGHGTFQKVIPSSTHARVRAPPVDLTTAAGGVAALLRPRRVRARQPWDRGPRLCHLARGSGSRAPRAPRRIAHSWLARRL